MHTNDDDSWEIAAQAALDIHRRTISAVRERVRTGTGTRRKLRPRTAFSRSRSGARTRPVSAPSERVKRRSRSASSTKQPVVLAPSLANVNVSNTAVNEISRAELEAWATLNQNTQRPRKSRTTVTFDRACPNSTVEHHPCQYSRDAGTPGRGRTATTAMPRGVEMHRCSLELLRSDQNSAAAAAAAAVANPAEANGAGWYERAARATPLPSAGKYRSGFRGKTDGAHNRSSKHNGLKYDGCGRQTLVRDQYLDGGNMGRDEYDAGLQREHQQDRSDISVRLLREHAKKAMKEEKAFLRSLRAESKAKEDIEIKMIHRATQWARELDKDVLYLPHRMGGKLHVLKIEKGFTAARFDEGQEHDGLINLEQNGTVLSVDFFVKADHARLEKERYAALDGGIGTKSGTAHTPGKVKGQPKGKRHTSSQKSVRDRPDAAETCRELHQLIRDTVGLVELLTRQAIELEGQGWNQPPGGGQPARQGKSRT